MGLTCERGHHAPGEAHRQRPEHQSRRADLTTDTVGAEEGFLWRKVGSRADSPQCKCPPSLLMRKVIGIAIVAAGLLGTIQVLWTQSGDFNPQTREPEQSMPEGNGGSSLARWAKPILPSAPEAATVVNLPPARTSSEPPLRTTRMFTDSASLTRTLQGELKRVGCYDGYINGDWTAPTRNAMKAFADYVNARLPVDKPDIVLLSLIQGYEGKACRGFCPTGQGLKDGHCIPNALIAHAKKPENVPPSLRKPPAAQRKRQLWRTLTPTEIHLPSPQPVSSAPQNLRVRIPQAGRRNRSAYVPSGPRFFLNSQDRASDMGQSGELAAQATPVEDYARGPRRSTKHTSAATTTLVVPPTAISHQ